MSGGRPGARPPGGSSRAHWPPEAEDDRPHATPAHAVQTWDLVVPGDGGDGPERCRRGRTRRTTCCTPDRPREDDVAKKVARAAVAASGRWTDPDGIRMPAGEVHAWERGTNGTVCGLALSRTDLERFPHVDWADVQPATGRHADEVGRVCPRCAAGMGARRDERPWTRRDPRP